MKTQKPNNTENKFEEQQNLLGFFDLLLKIDMRNHPENYKKQFRNEENREINIDLNQNNPIINNTN